MHRAVSLTLAAFLASVPSGSALSHEFWIAPERMSVAEGEAITADLLVGRMLRGEPYPFLSDRFTRFTVTADGQTTAIAGFEGDLPALGAVAARPGLNIFAHQTVPHRVTYDDWSMFRSYLADEGLDRFAEVHRNRGLPETGFAERYTRYAKALVQAGSARPGDRDTALGLALELVASANPYTADLDELPVTLLWQGEPVTGHQISVFADDGATVTRATVMTDQTGSAVISLKPGAWYLLNAVYLEPASDAPVVWQSHWASTTFGIAAGS